MWADGNAMANPETIAGLRSLQLLTYGLCGVLSDACGEEGARLRTAASAAGQGDVALP